MRYLYLSFLIACSLLFHACSSKQNSSPVSLVGKWNLQSQNMVTYVNNVKRKDTLLTASNKAMSFLQFNPAGSFMAISIYNSGGIGSTSLNNVVSVDTVRGVYSYTGKVFEISQAAISGLVTSQFSATSGPLPSITLVSQSATVNKLTSGSLNLHTEFTIKQVNGAVTTEIRTLSDYYYTR